MTTLIEKSILNERLEKSRSGIYADTSENRRKHRVGQKYGSEKKEEEKPEKTSSNEKDPAKELEAVDKVIAAINEGKLKLPQEEIKVLIEKKNNLELAKRQAEKIHSGVKANEERLIKRDGKERYEERLKQAKDEVAELKGEKPKEEKKPEAKSGEKEELDEDGELVTITNDKEKFERYRIFRDLHAARMKRGTSPTLSKMGYLKNSGDVNQKGNEKYYELQKEFGDKKYAFKEETQEQEPKSEKKADKASDPIYQIQQKKKEETSEEVKESYTRVKFEDVPNSGKVNLKKYLSEKVRKGVDEKWSNIKNIPTDNLKKMEKGLVNDLNKNFEAIKKSQRAELLYSIMIVKGELEKRGKESQKKE